LPRIFQTARKKNMPYIRALIAVFVVHGGLNHLLGYVLEPSSLVSIATGTWFGLGYARVFQGFPKADTFKAAFKGVIMAMLWPFVPVQHRPR